MARRGVKRASSKAAGGVAKQCRTIATTIKKADNVPAPVRSMLRDTLVRTFSTYKEERHAFQNTVSTTVGQILKETQKKLQSSITEAQRNKAGLEAEAANLTKANDAATAASDAAAATLANQRTAVADSKTALRDAKTALHDLQAAVKNGEAEFADATARKANLESCATDYVAPIKDGTKHGVTAGRHVAKAVAHVVDDEFLVCIERTFSKAHSNWGTFDNIVSTKYDGLYKKAVEAVTVELQQNEAAKGTRAVQIENQKGAITAAEDKVKAAQEAEGHAATAAKEAQGAAKTASDNLKAKQHQIEKAAAAYTAAENELEAFKKGALASYTEVEARTAPPPEPEKTEAAPALDQAMQPAAAAAQAPTMLPSPSVLLSRAAQAVGLAPSPRVAQSPRGAA